MTITADADPGALNAAATTDTSTLPWRPFRVAVARLEPLSPSFLRITFTGDDLDQFGHDGPDQRIKLYIPRPGQGLPEFSLTDWYAQYRNSDPDTRGFIRTYTIRAVRPGRRELDVDFVLHDVHGTHAGPADDGEISCPAASWAAGARVGDELVLIGPNRLYPADSGGYEWNPPVSARDIIIAGDETAVPAIAGILERLCDSPHSDETPSAGRPRVRVFLEVPDAADALDLRAPAHAEITWLPRRREDGASAANGQPLVDAVTSADFGTPRSASDDASAVDTVDIDLEVLWEVAAGATSSIYVWVAGEAGAVKAIRRHLVRERGVDKGAVTFMGYWRLGRSLD
ncbi:siderophore-interacting protein [Phytoactinopolyspora halotolerans]|uniref:Siderophore-interacting protein n=1 Tax=Phytoactinopolyspora halotolerans TaxID=1981512 RepID=A0A6L9S4I8_9ACTN|nr:siderophore-interacting protein [Phytoactinopolyspora halotolerans]NED99553.1 siderophore-interacting protein [Phytoactinopolyspora halotolerans]